MSDGPENGVDLRVLALPLPRGLRSVLEERFGLHVQPTGEAFRGEESLGWKLRSDRGHLLVQVTPRWRAFEELRWIHELVQFVSLSVPEAVAPLADLDGETAVPFEDRVAAVFPFIPGVPLDEGISELRDEAARLLARLHVAMLRWPGKRERPRSGSDAPASRTRVPDPPDIVDRDLDAWRAALPKSDDSLRGPIHGDYYRDNLRCRGNRILGVVDWYESHVDFLAHELGWSLWEFAHAPTGDELLPDRARSFLHSYVQAGGPVPGREHENLISFIRWRLREEIRSSLAASSRGEPWDPEYTAAELRAFDRLRTFAAHW